MFFETIKVALSSLSSNKLRSSLTTISIVMGICIVIIAMTVLEGFRTSVIEGSSILGSDVFQVQRYPDMFGFNHRGKRLNNPKIKKEIAQAIRDRCTVCALVGEEVWQFGQTIKSNYATSNPGISIAGGVPEYSPNNTEFVEFGRFFTYADVYAKNFVTVLGPEIAEFLFPNMQPVGRTVKIKGYKFEVIGILEEQGEMFGSNGGNRVVIPVTAWEKLYGKNTSYNITVQAKSFDLLEEAQDQVRFITRTERSLKPLEEDNFGLRTSSQFADTFNGVANAVALAAIAICSISLLVGGIGVMNIMLVSVTERTREIGIRKALGAKKSTIRTQFLLESIFITLIGGVIGILTGVGIGAIITHFLEFETTIPTLWILISVAFCATAGILAGFYPAVKASNLNPIDALRYE